jgi:MFS transporter, OFA family, oxalate/formate antiporter
MANESNTRGWMVTIAGLMINLALGVLYTWSVVTQTVTTKLKLVAGLPVPGAEAGTFISLAKNAAGQVLEKAIPISKAVLAERAFNWDPKAALLPYAIALLTFAFTMVFAGRAQDKWGPRIIATIGGVCVGLGMIIASFTDFSAEGNHLPIILGFGLLTGIGIGLAYACATPAAVKWFHASRRGLISGLVVGGFGLASVYTAPLTKALILSNGLLGAFRYLGMAFFVAIILLSQLLKNPPAGYVPPVPAGFKEKGPARTATGALAHVDYTWQQMMKTPQFYMLWLMYAFAAFAGLMMVGLIAKVAPEQLGDAKFAATWGYTLVVALALGNGLGRPLSGMVSDRIGRKPTMMGVFLLQALFVGVILSMAHSIVFLLVIAALIGSMYGANLSLFPAATYDFFGTKFGGVNYGLVFTAWGVGGAIGSYASGWIKDSFGNFVPAYYIAAGLLVLAAVLAVTVKPPKAIDMVAEPMQPVTE